MANNRIVRVGSRTSPLALAQNEEVLSLLRPLYPDVEFKAVPITTTGDRKKDAPLLSMQRGMFVKEIELALLRREIDMAVHSAKDLTVDIPDGLAISAAAERQDPRDVQVNRWGLLIAELPEGARMGTSSPRRTAQLKAQRPDVEVVPIRGNVGTRLDKARGPDYDGVLLAAAKSVNSVVDDPEPYVRFVEMGDSALLFQVQGWIDEPALRGQCIDGLNTAIYQALGAARIEIPFPQHVVHAAPPAGD